MCHLTFVCILSTGTICFEDRVCASKKGEIEGGGWVCDCVAALADCRMALIGTGWTISYFVSISRYRNHSHLVRAPFLVL